MIMPPGPPPTTMQSVEITCDPPRQSRRRRKPALRSAGVCRRRSRHPSCGWADKSSGICGQAGDDFSSVSSYQTAPVRIVTGRS